MKTLADTVQGKLVNNRFSDTCFTGVSIDSRSVCSGQLFVAIVGEKNNGHNFIDHALEKESSAILVADDYKRLAELRDTVPMVSVPDTHKAMMHLAKMYRDRVGAIYIAITGSNGKTTTKELTYSMIKSLCNKTYRSKGNLNNQFGLPLAIFSLPEDSTYAIFELGISLPDEMIPLADILQPNIAVITNIGPTHLETMGTMEIIAREKFRLIDSMPDKNPAVVNADDPYIRTEMSRRSRAFITYGFSDSADIQAKESGIDTDGYPKYNLDGHDVSVQMFGNYQVYNLLAGYSVCKALGLDLPAESMNSINQTPVQYRGEIENVNSLTIIADCYNANPASMKAGLESFAGYLANPALQNRRSIAVIGDMLELGDNEENYHRDIGWLDDLKEIDLVLTVGPLSNEIYRSALESGRSDETIMHFDNAVSAGEYLIDIVRRGDIIYLKASRGIALEKVITLLKGAAFRGN